MFPLISIIIPVYNVEKYLRKCLDSIVTQTLKDIEIICVNDGTKDNSVTILNEYADNDKRIKIIHKKNGGLSSARNEGLRHATAEYIGFVDSDDWIEQETYELAYKAMIENNADMVCWCAQIETETGCTESHPNVYNYHAIRVTGIHHVSNELLLNTTVTAWNKLYKKKIIDEFGIKFPVGFLHEDIEFFSLYSVRCNYIYYIDKYLHHYLQRANSIVANCEIKLKKIKLDNIEVPFRVSKYYADNGLLPKYAQFLSKILFWAFEEVYNNAKLENKLKVLNFTSKFVKRMDLSLLDDSLDFFYKLYNKDYSNISFLNESILHFDFFTKIFKDNHKVLVQFLFFKIKFDYPFIKILLNKYTSIKTYISNIFLKISKIPKEKVLIIEANNCHGECIPGYTNYFMKLGYDVHVITTNELAIFRPCYMFTDAEIGLSVMEKDSINTFFVNNNSLSQYKWIVLNSKILYRPVDGIWKEFEFFDIYPSAIQYREKIISIQHHAELHGKGPYNSDRTIMLEEFDLHSAYRYISCTPFYYGKRKITHKNPFITNFILVGAIENARRNYEILITAIKELHDRNIKNFVITVIGRGWFPEIFDKELYHYLNILGEVDFPTLHSAMDSSDFILMLFDPNNTKHVDKFIKNGTSGNFMLSFGFLKPCILHKDFAEKRKLDHKNALVYSNNYELSSVMEHAIKITGKEYIKIQNNLGTLKKTIYRKSLRNLKKEYGSKINLVILFFAPLFMAYNIIYRILRKLYHKTNYYKIKILQGRINELTLCLEDTNKWLIKTNSRINETDDWLSSTFKMLNETASHLSDTNQWLNNTHKRVEEIYKSNADGNIKLNETRNKLDDTYNWLSNTHKWVEEICKSDAEGNKKLDETCNLLDETCNLLDETYKWLGNTHKWVEEIYKSDEVVNKRANEMKISLNRIMIDQTDIALNELGNPKNITNKLTKNNDLKLLPAKSNNFDLKDINVLTNELKKLDGFLFCPNNGNLGDVIIAEAEYQFFTKHKIKYSVLDLYNNKKIDNQILHTNYVYGGGGIFIKLYDYQSLKDIFLKKHFKKILILPSSFNKCDDLIKIFDERFVVFCREEQSFDYCTSINNKAKFILSHDLAFSINFKLVAPEHTLISKHSVGFNKHYSRNLYEAYSSFMITYNNIKQETKNKCSVVKGGLKLCIMLRTDKESNIPKKKKTRYLANTLDLSNFGWFSCTDAGLTKVLSFIFIQTINFFDIIITDRLHIGIVSALLGKTVYLLDNNYGKLSGVYEQSMSSFKKVRMYSDISEIEKDIGESGFWERTNKTNAVFNPEMTFQDFLEIYFSAYNPDNIVTKTFLNNVTEDE